MDYLYGSLCDTPPHFDLVLNYEAIKLSDPSKKDPKDWMNNNSKRQQ